MTALICMAGPFYEYKGFKFELHPFCGPMPLRKDLEPRLNVPKGFWDAYYEWDKMGKKEKQKTLIKADQ